MFDSNKDLTEVVILPCFIKKKCWLCIHFKNEKKKLNVLLCETRKEGKQFQQSRQNNRINNNKKNDIAD